MLKKVLIILSLLILVGCEPEASDEPNVRCDLFPEHEACDPIDPVDPVGPIDPVDPIDIPETVDPRVYTNFEGRDIVSDDCDYLENLGEWQPVWCDEFNYTGLPDSDLWNYDIGGSGWGNGEAQYYTFEDEDNAYVGNGVLTIKAIKEYYQGNEYTSARLITKNTGDWLYGKIQVKAKLPSGKGTWPAIWMLPTDWEYGGWPDSGEIDIMEFVGYDGNRVHSTIHTKAYNHSIGTQVGVSKTLNDLEDAFHVYEIEWEPGVIRTYVDGEIYATFDYDAADNIYNENFEAWPFDKDFHLILNLAIGGAWGGAQGIDDSIFPTEFLIDYVRVYQKDYVGMDVEAPSNPGNLAALNETSNSIFIGWDVAVDDVLVKEYKILVNDVLYDTTTVSGMMIEGLEASTNYTIKVIAVDFVGNESSGSTMNKATKAPPSVNTRVEAEDFSSMTGIQTEETSDAGGGLNVGWIDQGDSLTYNLQVTEAGTYKVNFRITSPAGGGTFNFMKDATLLDSVSVPSTGGWQSWDTTSSNSFYLEVGTYTFEIDITYGGFNLNYFEFEKVS